MISLSKALGEISIAVAEVEKRMALLEHSANQQSILLDAVLTMLERGMEENSTTKHTTSNGGYSRREQNM